MIREMKDEDRKSVDEMQFELQKYFSKIDQTHESLPYKGLDDTHQYMQQMIDDVVKMNGKVFVAEEDSMIVGFIQGVIIEHKEGEDKIYDLFHNPSKEGWIGLLFVLPEYRHRGIGKELMQKMKDCFRSKGCTSVKLLVLSDNTDAIRIYEKNGFLRHDLETTLQI